MARANRHHIPGQVWHITHRCHDREFLLKFARDRRRWLHWLFESKKRYDLQILNYIVTSNHIHLLVLDGDEDVIPRSLQLTAGQTGEEYNRRKGRKGAFWDDRYHATAVETEKHFFRCLAYIDLNMVRANVVRHPSEWPFSGYNEIQNPPRRYSLIDRESLIWACAVEDDEHLRQQHRQLIEEALTSNSRKRQPEWTEAIAVGSKPFVQSIKEKLGLRASGRKLLEASGQFVLREPGAAYNDDLGTTNGLLSAENAFIWNVESNKSAC